MNRIPGPYPSDPRQPYRGGGHAPGPMPGMVGRPTPIDPRLQSRAPKPAHSLFGKILWVAVIGFVALGLAGATFYLFHSGLINLPFSGTSESPSAAEGTVIFSGRADQLHQARGNTIQQDPSNSSVVWIKSSLANARPSGSTDGISITVPKSVVADARRVRVTISARGVGVANQAPFAVAYSAGSAGNSGWLVFEPTNKFKDFSFTYAVPRGASGVNNYVGVWSDITGRNAPLAIRRISITRLP
jgi:hypothetical protein